MNPLVGKSGICYFKYEAALALSTGSKIEEGIKTSYFYDDLIIIPLMHTNFGLNVVDLMINLPVPDLKAVKMTLLSCVDITHFNHSVEEQAHDVFKVKKWFHPIPYLSITKQYYGR